MKEDVWLARRFDENRTHLRTVAYRMLGSASEAEDAVQEAWLKLSRSGSRQVENLGGWLTTVIARVCLDMLRTRRSRREEPLLAAADMPSDASFEDDLALADATGPALLVILETLPPAERVAFVLHDMFNLSFEDIARILDRTPTAARKRRRLTSRCIGSWSAHSWRPRARAISNDWLPCCRPTWCCAPMRRQCA